MMQRYEWGATGEGFANGNIVASAWPTEKGEWVKYSDAEDEIDKARQGGRDEVLQHRLAEHWPNVQARLTEKARADERERIVRDLSEMVPFLTKAAVSGVDLGVKMAIERIKSRHPQEPKPLERLKNPYADLTLVDVACAINSLIDAENIRIEHGH
jgi:hypothetical protein